MATSIIGVSLAGDAVDAFQMIEQGDEVAGVEPQRIGQASLGNASVVAQESERQEVHGAQSVGAAFHACFASCDACEVIEQQQRLAAARGLFVGVHRFT